MEAYIVILLTKKLKGDKVLPIYIYWQRVLKSNVERERERERERELNGELKESHFTKHQQHWPLQHAWRETAAARIEMKSLCAINVRSRRWINFAALSKTSDRLESKIPIWPALRNTLVLPNWIRRKIINIAIIKSFVLLYPKFVREQQQNRTHGS